MQQACQLYKSLLFNQLKLIINVKTVFKAAVRKGLAGRQTGKNVATANETRVGPMAGRPERAKRVQEVPNEAPEEILGAKKWYGSGSRQRPYLQGYLLTQTIFKNSTEAS